MPIDWRYNWCESEICACVGCVNVSGKLIEQGYTKKDWEEWVKENPKK